MSGEQFGNGGRDSCAFYSVYCSWIGVFFIMSIPKKIFYLTYCKNSGSLRKFEQNCMVLITPGQHSCPLACLSSSNSLYPMWLKYLSGSTGCISSFPCAFAMLSAQRNASIPTAVGEALHHMSSEQPMCPFSVPLSGASIEAQRNLREISEKGRRAVGFTDTYSTYSFY